MAAFLNAVISDIANRFVAFLMDKCLKVTNLTTEGIELHDLQRLLLRVRVIVDEADGRHIINPAMSYQLNILRKEMYRGYFTLDSFRNQGTQELEAKDHDVSTTFALSKFDSAKRLFLSIGNAHMEKDLQQVLDNLSNILADVGEFVTLLNNYPPMYRQPYCMHLYIGNCMFGRQMEMDTVIDFLMRREYPIMENVGVLPIVGPVYVGKSTLVAHVYNDERVRNHFSQIVVITGDEINYENAPTLKDRVPITHRDNVLDRNDRLLVIIEFSRDADEVAWNSFYSSASSYLGMGSKMIITSRSDSIIKFGTTQALVLNFLPREAYWYFFKTLTFGSVDSNDHPKLEAIAMEIARCMNGAFISANINSGLLRKKLNSKYWHMFLQSCKAHIRKNISLFGEDPYTLTRKNKPSSLQLPNIEKFAVYSPYCERLPKDNVPTITLHDLLSKSVKCEGEIEVLVWKSHILPFKSYFVTCTLEQLHT